MNPSLVDRPFRRIEDPALVTGGGTFINNLPLDGAAVAHFVTSVYAHARITGVDTAEARSMPGVAPTPTLVAVQWARPPSRRSPVPALGHRLGPAATR